MKDLYNHLTLVQAVAPVVVKTGTVPNPAAVDLAGYNSAVIEMSCGAKPSGEDGAITLKLEHADDSTTPGTAGTFSSVAAADVQGATPNAGIIKTLLRLQLRRWQQSISSAMSAASGISD